MTSALATRRLYSARVASWTDERLSAAIVTIEARLVREHADLNRRGGSHAAAAVVASSTATLRAYRQALADRS